MTLPDPRDAHRAEITRRRQARRRFGAGPYVVGLAGRGDAAAFPWSVPALGQLDQLDLSAPVTFLAGDNGMGKSTIVEGLAEAMGFAPQGGEYTRLEELPPSPRAVASARTVAPSATWVRAALATSGFRPW